MVSATHHARNQRGRCTNSLRLRHNWITLTTVLALVWAVELFVFQERTLVPAWQMLPHAAIASRVIRFALDLSFCMLLAATLKGRWIYVGFSVGFLCLIGLDVYHAYFGHALSFSALAHQGTEGAAVFSYAVSLIRWHFVLFAGAFLGLKVVIHKFRARTTPSSPRTPLISAGVAAMSYLLVFSVVNTRLDPLRKFRIHGSVDRMGATYGYLPAWIGEAWYARQDALLERAIRAAAAGTNRLAPIETPIVLTGNMVIIQVESMGADILGFEHEGELVMPFVTTLGDSAMFYRVKAIHSSGSADADFVMLTGRMPSPDIITYKIVDYQYAETLPKLAHREGYISFSLHGTTGAFFNRRGPFQRMGFDTILFQEELEELLGKDYSDAAVQGVKDTDLLQFAGKVLQEHPNKRILCFIITLTSHGPFTSLEPAERELFPDPKNTTEHYLNSMRYVDRAIEHFLAQIEYGTTVVLYGDHGVRELPQSDPDAVPFLIYQSGTNLASVQTTRHLSLSTSGELTLQDAALYVWTLLSGGRADGTSIANGSPLDSVETSQAAH